MLGYGFALKWKGGFILQFTLKYMTRNYGEFNVITPNTISNYKQILSVPGGEKKQDLHLVVSFLMAWFAVN